MWWCSKTWELNIIIYNQIWTKSLSRPNNWKHKCFFIEVSKNESDRVFDLIICKNKYALIKKIDVFFKEIINVNSFAENVWSLILVKIC